MTKKKKGKSISNFFNNPFDFTLLITILLLLSIGLVMVLSASSPSALSKDGDSYSYFSKQLLFAILGIVAMLFISKIDYRFYQKLVVFYAGILTKNRDKLGKYGSGFIWHMVLLAPIIGLLLLEPHFSSSIVIIGICSIMMIVAGCKFWHFLATGSVVGIPAIIALIILEPYRLQRVVTFLDPWKDPTDTGWQVIQSLYAIGSRWIIWCRFRRK